MLKRLKKAGLAVLVVGGAVVASAVPAVAQTHGPHPTPSPGRPEWIRSSFRYRAGHHTPDRPANDGHRQLPTITNTLAASAPAEVDVNPETGRVYVGNFGNNTVTVLDPRSDATVATIPVGSGPGGIVFDHNRVYVANAFDGTISVIDARTNVVVNTINTGTTGLNSMVLNHRTRKLYVSVYRSEVLIYDLRTNQVRGSIADDDANFLAINERTNRVYVTNYDNATVSVVDGRIDQIIDTVQVGPAAFPDDCYETNSCTINPAGPDGIAVNLRTNRLYVNNVITGTLVTIDGNTDQVTHTVQQLPGQFWSVVDEATNTVYSTNFAESTLSVLDGRTNKIVGMVQIGDGFQPSGCFSDQATCTSFGAGSSTLAFSTQTGKIYVPNFSGGSTSSGTISVLSTRLNPAGFAGGWIR